MRCSGYEGFYCIRNSLKIKKSGMISVQEFKALGIDINGMFYVAFCLLVNFCVTLLVQSRVSQRKSNLDTFATRINNTLSLFQYTCFRMKWILRKANTCVSSVFCLHYWQNKASDFVRSQKDCQTVFCLYSTLACISVPKMSAAENILIFFPFYIAFFFFIPERSLTFLPNIEEKVV